MRIKLHKVRNLKNKLCYGCCILLLFIICNNCTLGIYITLTKLINLTLGTTRYFDFNDYLISTSTCNIPNFDDKIVITNSNVYKQKCPVRAVFIKSVGNDKIKFEINKKNMLVYVNKKIYSKLYCCYKYLTETNDRTLKYSKCSSFKNGATVKLLQETIRITCTVKEKKQTNIVYDDIYKILKKRNNKIQKMKMKPWNVLILGMRGMSRARFYNSMIETAKAFQEDKWLDFRGFNKIAQDSLSNVVTLLTGKTYSGKDTFTEFVWNVYENATYVTAFGDDDKLQLLDNLTRKLKIRQPDHHIQPIYHIDQRRIGNYMCTKKLPSGIHLLDYATQFVNSYKNENFFGFFWLNSYTQHYDGLPSLVDSEIVKLFRQIKNIGVYNNTFIIFLSDSGVRMSKKSSTASHYEERLPTLFIWVPLDFRTKYQHEYSNMKLNQFNLVTPYDVYNTLRDILEFKQATTNSTIADCTTCKGLFKTISLTRTCADASIDEQFCACRDYYSPSYSDYNVQASLELAVSYIKQRSESVQTITCMICEHMELNKLISVHSYSYSNRTYYILEIEMNPRNMVYEATVVLNNKLFSIVHPIAGMNQPVTGRCATKIEDSIYCACNVTVCKMNGSLSDL